LTIGVHVPSTARPDQIAHEEEAANQRNGERAPEDTRQRSSGSRDAERAADVNDLRDEERQGYDE
jgi:hypothetical protein